MKLDKLQRELAEEEEREKADKSSASLEDIKTVLKDQLGPLKSQLKDVVKEVNKLKSREIAKALTPSSAKKDQPSTSASKPTKESVKRALIILNTFRKS